MGGKRKPTKKPVGGVRMAELGYKPIQIWVDRDDMDLLKSAAEFEDRPMTRFVLRAALEAARLVKAKLVD